MAIAIGVAGTPATGTTALTVTIPATATVGHLMVMSVGSSNGTTLASAATATGWTQLDTATDTGGSPCPTVTILWRVCVSGDPGATVALTFANTVSTTVGVVNTYSGTDTTTPFESHAANFEAGAGSTTHATSSITTANSNDWILGAFVERAASTWTPPASYTERTDTATTATSLETVDSNTTVASGSISITATATGSSSTACMWIGALQPPVAATVGLVVNITQAINRASRW